MVGLMMFNGTLNEMRMKKKFFFLNILPKPKMVGFSMVI